jgi:signal transduction histidine kinase
LVRNAVQAEATQVEIRQVLTPTSVRVLIIDNGTGIPEKIRNRIFEPNFSTKNSGMGLGLAITKRMVENMNGEIGFSTEEGKGTTFTVEFPLEATDPTNVG